MLWKSKPGRSNRDTSRAGGDLFSRVRGDIPLIRKQGEPPEKDASSFSRYHCDLCNDSFPSTGLKQCTLCGRWSCPSCFTSEYYICNSCNGIVRLHLLQNQQVPPRGSPKGRQEG